MTSALHAQCANPHRTGKGTEDDPIVIDWEDGVTDDENPYKWSRFKKLTQTYQARLRLARIHFRARASLPERV